MHFDSAAAALPMQIAGHVHCRRYSIEILLAKLQQELNMVGTLHSIVSKKLTTKF
jgi:hypothetical protein